MSYEEAAQYADERGLGFFEASAKDGSNVQEVYNPLPLSVTLLKIFYYAAEMILDKLEKGEIDPIEVSDSTTAYSNTINSGSRCKDEQIYDS